jgi:hypothetical protein
MMKKTILTTAMALLVGMVSAQQTANDYIVKTKNAKKTAAAGATAISEEEKQEEKAHDFVSENFRYYSLCDWEEGMKFMVMPEKYDMVVKTFHDAATGKEVSSMTLRHKIMLYKGHTVSAEGHARINFLCQDNNRNFYYEIPNGTFEDYCFGKMGVPTLAYLGDVDIAREKLIGRTMYTKSTLYRIDTEYDGEGFQEVTVPENEEVTVRAVGVGTRSFPVKIIVEDKKGNEFYQNVAISKTNSGMRDDEFVADNAKFSFSGSFELEDATMEISKKLAKYIGQKVHTKYTTTMSSKVNGTERQQRVPRLTTFKIENVTPKSNSKYVTLTLSDQSSRRVYLKDVTFENVDNVAGDIDGRREDYFGYLFAMGAARKVATSAASRAAIRQGRVIKNMTEDEVEQSVGSPDMTAESSNGRHDWIYNRDNGKTFIVQFGKNGKVIGTNMSSTKR